MDIAERCIDTEIDCIVGLEGGTTLDVAKKNKLNKHKFMKELRK